MINQPNVKHNYFHGNVKEFTEWWNKQGEDDYGGAYSIIYIKECETQDSDGPHSLVEYVIQWHNIKN